MTDSSTKQPRQIEASTYALVIYVPVADCPRLKEALFAAGAGRIGHYDCCCWQVEGLGQFRPLAGANPHLGTTDCVEQVKETRLEMLVLAKDKEVVQHALLDSHPYETPAYYWLPVANQV